MYDYQHSQTKSQTNSTTGATLREVVFSVCDLEFLRVSLYDVRLEAEDLVLKLADGPGLRVAKRLGGLLHGTDHGRRAADEDLDIGSGAREFVL